MCTCLCQCHPPISHHVTAVTWSSLTTLDVPSSLRQPPTSHQRHAPAPTTTIGVGWQWVRMARGGAEARTSEVRTYTRTSLHHALPPALTYRGPAPAPAPPRTTAVAMPPPPTVLLSPPPMTGHNLPPPLCPSHTLSAHPSSTCPLSRPLPSSGEPHCHSPTYLIHPGSTQSTLLSRSKHALLRAWRLPHDGAECQREVDDRVGLGWAQR